VTLQKAQQSRRVGLARALSKLGYCSRSQAAELIRAGQVRLNGVTRRDPETPVRLHLDRVEAEGREVAAAEKIYLMLNKPRGVVTTASDEQGRETVYSCLGDAGALHWLAPVGRLDKASEGLLLFTNDSAWAACISTPETHLDKTYHVQVSSIVDGALFEKIRGGVRAAGNGAEILRAKAVEILRRGKRNSWLAITLDEGKNRHIRRMLDALGLEVRRLVRVAIGPLALGDLQKGAYRPLTADEKRSLGAAMSGRRTAGPANPAQR
jgi:23S rRNA pseudouridine2605 synthase